MIDRSTLALLIAIAALFPASVAFAQTREAFGPGQLGQFVGPGFGKN